MKTYFKTVFIASSLVISVSCSKEDKVSDQNNTSAEVSITASDFEGAIVENPENQSLIGTVEASTTSGTLNFEITSQTPENAMTINATSGALNVADSSLFDYEATKEIIATILVKNGSASKTVTAKITLKDFTPFEILKEEDIIAYYPFNGDAKDASKNMRHSTKNNATLTNDRFDNKESAYDVAANHIVVPALKDYTQFSVSAWVKTNALDYYQSIISQTGTSRDFGLRINNEKYCHCLFAYFSSGSNNVSSSEIAGTFPVNVWKHITMVYNDGTVTLYIDGESVGTKTLTEKIVWSSTDLSIGALSAEGGERFDGAIDDVLFTSTILSENAIKQLAAE